MSADTIDIEKRLWDAADVLRANSDLKASEYSVPVLGLIFLRFADHRYTRLEEELGDPQRMHSACRARGILYLPPESRFSHLLGLPPSSDLAQAVNTAMRAVEQANEELHDVLPKRYERVENKTLGEVVQLISTIPMDIKGDAFGRIYEYFLGKFAMREGQKGGEFYTPTAVVQLIVEIIEPFHGRILDPACGSGGMFVQSARFVENHRRDPNAEIALFGQDRVAETVRLCRMNQAIHGLSAKILQGNAYYQDLHDSIGKFDFVMGNPPFNVWRVDLKRTHGDPRFPFGVPQVVNGNYLWIQIFYSALNEQGRAGFVMANSASDARASEREIRRQLLQTGVVDVIIAVASKFFYTVSLPCTLWFLDKAKIHTARRDKILFIDARHIFRLVRRAHRDFTPVQIEFLANLVRLYRGEATENQHGSAELMAAKLAGRDDLDVPGLCRVATLAEVEARDWSLNPGRYVGVAEEAEEEFDFAERVAELNDELQALNQEARELETAINKNIETLLSLQ